METIKPISSHLATACLTARLLLAVLNPPAHAKIEDREKTGEWLQILIPAAGLADTCVADD